MKKWKWIGILGIAMSMFSCRTAQHLTSGGEVPFLSASKLWKQMEMNAFQDSTFFAKRIEVTLSDDGKSEHFKASLRMKRDDFMQVSVTAPLGIEMARVLLTPDSIKFMDTYHKQYFMTDYVGFYRRYKIPVSYDFLQQVFTNAFFSFDLNEKEPVKIKHYKLEPMAEGYRLWTTERSGNERRGERSLQKWESLISAKHFRPLFLSVEDLDKGTTFSVAYDGFTDFNGTLFPEKMCFRFLSEKENVVLELKFQRIEFNVPVESRFRISPKYKRME